MLRLEVNNGIGSVFCLMADFGISDVHPSGYATTVLIKKISFSENYW
jgi:hypothetical protein